MANGQTHQPKRTHYQIAEIRLSFPGVPSHFSTLPFAASKSTSSVDHTVFSSVTAFYFLCASHVGVSVIPSTTGAIHSNPLVKPLTWIGHVPLTGRRLHRRLYVEIESHIGDFRASVVAAIQIIQLSLVGCGHAHFVSFSEYWPSAALHSH